MAPYDEEGIEADDRIIRRIDREQHVIWDDNRQCYRISSKAFQASSAKNGGMSVDIENLILEAGKDPGEFVTNPRFQGSVWWPARSIRELDLWIGYSPIEPENPFHGEVWKPGDRPNKFTSRQKSGLQRNAQWFVNIPGVDIS